VAHAKHPRPRRLARRAAVALVLALVLLSAAVALAYRPLVRALGGSWEHAPSEMAAGLGDEARALLARAYEGIDPARLVDVHAHLAGIGTDGSGCEVNARMRSWRHPLSRLRFDFYLSGAGVTDLAHADRQVVERLADLARHADLPARRYLLAFDRHYRADGTVDAAKSGFHVPNEWVWRVAREHPGLFAPAISVHPYRSDALAELERWGARGVKIVKWLPNAMGIDPADPRCDAFYATMRVHEMVLLSHTGKELAVASVADQGLGNPLRLRRPLDAGLRVIAAHCAGLGTDEDLDRPGRPRVASFELFLRLMDEERYEGLFFGDLSAVLLFNRSGEHLRTLLEREDLHARLVDGSDYPLPAIDALVHTGSFAREGYITPAESRALEEIYDYNPLVYDFALKRTLRLPASGRGFAAAAFERPPGLGL